MFCNQASNLIPYVAQPADATFDSHNSQKIPGKTKIATGRQTLFRASSHSSNSGSQPRRRLSRFGFFEA
jgi:hypothetical protein